MRRGLITVVVIVLLALVLALLIAFLLSSGAKVSYAHTPMGSALPVASPITSSTPMASSQSTSGSGSGIDPAVIAAVIAFLGVLVTAEVSLYLFRRTRELEREKIFLQDQVTATRAAKEREEQRKEAEAEAANIAMLRARNIKERVQAYRKALHADPNIAQLQILDMSRPLEVTNVYIQVRLHQETRPGYELDSASLEAESMHDPNELLKASQLRLESRAQAAINPDEAIRKYRHCVVVGDPGAGKTTLLKYLTLNAVDNQLIGLPNFPIHIELNAFASSGHRDPLEFAASVWEKRYSFPKAEALDYMKGRLNEGKAILLLDGLDETVTGKTREESEESYKQATKTITDLVACYHRSPIVVTARKAGYHQRTRLAGFTELEVLDFRPEDIKQFVEKWFVSYTDSQKHASADDLNTRLERNPRIQALAANPLLLSLIVIVYEAQLDLSDRRAELYKQCVDTLLTRWDASRDIRRRREFKPEHKRQLLEEIAWHFHLQGQRYFPENELLQVIADFLPAIALSAEQNGQILNEVAAENGLLKEQARGWYGILHLTLQEYFVALYAVDHKQLDTLLAHRGEPWWEEVILLYAGSVPDASLLLRKLLGQDEEAPLREDIFYTNLILAGRCLAAWPTVRQASLRGEIIARLFDMLTETHYSLTQEQIAEVLAEIGGTEVNRRLLGILADDQLEQRKGQIIANALGERGEYSLAPALLSLLPNERINCFVRRDIAYALGKLGEHSITSKLLALLSNEQIDSLVRWSIAFTLSQLGEQSQATELLQLLTNPHLDPFVGDGIALALSKLARQSMAPDLLTLLSNPQIHPSVRVSIVSHNFQLIQDKHEEVAKMGFNKQIDPSGHAIIGLTLYMQGDYSLLSELLELLPNEQIDLDVRRNIARNLGIHSKHSIAFDLLELLSNAQIDPLVRNDFIFTLPWQKEPHITPR